MPPAPIDSLVTEAATANIKIELDSDDEIVLTNPNGGTIPLLHWGKRAWDNEVKNTINDSCVHILAIAVRTQDEKGTTRKPRRADMD